MAKRDKPVAKTKKRKSSPRPKEKAALRFDAFADSYLETAMWADRPEDCDADEI